MGSCCSNNNRAFQPVENVQIIPVRDLNEKAAIIQKFYRKYRASKRKISNTNTTNAPPPNFFSQDEDSQIVDEDPNNEKINNLTQIIANNELKSSKEKIEIPELHEIVKELPITDAPIDGKKLDHTPSVYQIKVQQVMLKMGNFPYKTYIEKYQDKEEAKKPFLDPYELENGSIYVGQWKQGLRHGRGKIIWLDGSIYEGFWKNDKASGFGRLIYENGDVYIGEFCNGLANGLGTFTTQNFEYKGNFVNDKSHGSGEEKWTDGTIFKGQYEDGKKTGYGEFHFKDGSRYHYKISFYLLLLQRFSGEGIFQWSDGRKYEGEWHQNKMHGLGKFYWVDGRKYDGEYILDVKQGFGVFTWPDGRSYKGEWHNGKQHGKGTYISKTGLSRDGTWIDGKRVKWRGNYAFEF